MQRYNILIVEDESANAEFLELVLESLGHHIVGVADNANEAIHIAKRESIDFVFMDIDIKGDIDGIQCSILLNHSQDIATIYLTAFEDSDTIAEAANTNIYGYILKPFKQKDIETTLAVAIAKKRVKVPTEVLPKSSIALGEGYYYDLDSQILYLKTAHEVQFIHLSKTLNRVLYLLILHLDQVVSFEKFFEVVWSNKRVSESAIRDAVSRLRKEVPQLQIQTVSGVGYHLKSFT
ncbi:MAG: response regulator [Campylobacterales bacterium]|nr:response regulator [Campylobacterales bacterium]